MSFDALITAKAAELLDACRQNGLKLATAESCTGGLVAGAITSIAGASDVFEAGFVTYSNDAKTRMIGVSAGLIGTHGAVSEQVACAMCEAILEVTGADIALAVTGIAGPGGGSAEKPVGLVYVAAARRGYPTRHRKLTLGNPGRDQIRLRSVAEVLKLGHTQAAAVP